MKAKELREQSTEELQAKTRDMRDEIFKLNLQKHGGQIEKPSRIRELRRDIARVETVLTEKRRAAAPAAAAK
ncbi:MAG: 50S ribosomal protein L29 [Verrucomicrobia bacterium]|nr:50S ribosomal protein L29 [Verrucomicrobiota bacterium]